MCERVSGLASPATYHLISSIRSIRAGMRPGLPGPGRGAQKRMVNVLMTLVNLTEAGPAGLPAHRPARRHVGRLLQTGIHPRLPRWKWPPDRRRERSFQ